MQTINLTQNNFKMPPVVYMVQNDTGRSLKMILDDVTLAGTETGAVAIRRSEGSYYTITATLVAADNAFTIEADQALTQPGKTECQLKVTDSNNDVISSYTFRIIVQASTDGISEEQLGYSVQDVVSAANTIISGGMPLAVRNALLQIAEKVSYIDGNGATYYQDLYNALMPASLSSISCVYTQSGTVYSTDSLDSLKADLVVTAHYSDGTSDTVLSSAYILSGSLDSATSTITVSYDGKTTTFTVNVTIENWTWTYDPSTDGVLTSQSYVYVSTQSTGVTDEISGDKWKVTVPQGTSETSLQMRLGDGNGNYTVTQGHLRIKLKFDTLSYQENLNGFRAQVSKGSGTGAAKFGIYKSAANTYKLSTVTGTSTTPTVIQSVTPNTWYVFDIKFSTSSFTISVDGEVVYTSSSPSTVSASYNGLYIVASGTTNALKENTVVYVEYVKFLAGGVN